MYIKGITKTLAGAMRKLVELHSVVYQDPKPEGQEYGYFVFEKTPKVSTVQNLPHKLTQMSIQ